MKLCLAAVVGLGMMAVAGPVGGREVFAGPVAAHVIKIIDGDTFEARAQIWLGQEIVVRVRLDGIDTPELRARCQREAQLAAQARGFTAARLWPTEDSAGVVALEDIHYGKYAGRVLARVRLADGSDLGSALIAAGLARRYEGQTRPNWCDGEDTAAEG